MAASVAARAAPELDPAATLSGRWCAQCVRGGGEAEGLDRINGGFCPSTLYRRCGIDCSDLNLKIAELLHRVFAAILKIGELRRRA